jgi:outer membrane lipase/esterase
MKSITATSVIALGLIAFGAPASAQSLTKFFGFGDSTIDSGWYANSTSGTAGFDARIAAAIALGGQAKPGGPGLMNSEVLAMHFGLSANPANTPGGTNYATSGARDSQINQPGDGLFLGAVPTATQISNYLSAYGHADRNALYLISSGGNDVAFALDNLPAPQRNAYVTTAANDLVAAIAKLSSSGARYVIVPNLNEDFGNANTRALRALYNTALWGGLAAAGVNFIPADSNTIRAVLGNNPAAFGITFTANGTPGPGTASACQSPPGSNSAWGLICTPSTTPNATTANLVSNDAALTHLFADDQHFAAVGQRVYGDYYASLVYAPSQISLLAENPVKIREGLAATIGDQIAISRRVRGPLGFNGWVSGDVSSLKVNNGPGFASETSTPAQIAAGFDYRFMPGILVGAAFSFDTKKPTFDTGGTFKQDEYTASLYAGFTQNGFWLDLIGTYGSLKYDINRRVPVGITIQPNAGSTSGTNWSLAATGGFDMINGPWTHGPVIGILLQRIRVGGFTETGSFTSLSFADQTRDSAIGSFGYRVAFDAGMFRPFVRLLWNHEFANTERQIVTALTTTVAPSYSLPAIETGKDWGSGTAGTQIALGGGVTGLLSVTGQVGQDRIVRYGGQAGLNVAF